MIWIGKLQFEIPRGHRAIVKGWCVNGQTGEILKQGTVTFEVIR